MHPKVHRAVNADGSTYGYHFMCPGCENIHTVTAGPAGWTFNGDMVRPTFKPSVLVNGRSGMINPNRPRCHSFVESGRIRFLSDCSHALAGQTVDLGELPSWLTDEAAEESP